MKKSKILMILGPLFLLGLFVYPLWRIQLEAPQYPIPLGMYIHINKITDDAPFDVKNINLMNHYVGMKEIPEHMAEFDIFPPVIIGMVILGVFVGFMGRWKFYLGWFALMSLMGIAGMYDFYLWEHDYGYNLDPHAIMKFTNPDGSIMGFQPPLWGSKVLLNFVAHSYPATGAYLMFVGMMMTFFAGILGFFESKKENK
jgi:hypothetical protein